MKKTENYFNSNLNALKKKQPELAEKLLSVQVQSYYTVVYSKNGYPVLKTQNITFHSMYDPVKEGLDFVESNLKRNTIKPGEQVIVFGLGFAYHIKPMLERNLRALIVEPRIEILRLAMEQVDLTDLIEKMDIKTGSETDFSISSSAVLWAHQPSVKYNKATYERLKNTDVSVACPNEKKAFASEKSKLKIVVLTPIYGGSLPVATYCCHALMKLGHEVHLWDASVFEKPFQKVLELNLDDRNKKVLYDLFLHLISEMIVASCSDFRPDLVLALAQTPLSIKALERLRQSKITTAFWFVEDYQVMEYWRTYAPYYDFYFTIQENGFISELEKLGIKNYYYLPLAADTEIHRPLNMTKQEKEEFGSEISFMGAGYYNRERMFLGLLDFDFKLWGTQWDPQSILSNRLQRDSQRLSTEETVKVFNATEINLNLHSSVCHDGVNPFGDFVNPRTFEIASCGSFQLVDYRSMVSRHFNIGEEIVCYSCLEELRDQIQYYLKHCEERMKIAHRARERILKEHTYEHRMRELLFFIRERKPECFYLKGSNTPVVRDVHAFCAEHPEVRPIVESAGKGGAIDLDQILSVINSRRDSLQYHEAIFLLMKDFQDLFGGTRV